MNYVTAKSFAVLTLSLIPWVVLSGQSRNATMQVTNWSIDLYEAYSSSEGGLGVIFSTYDGLHDWPLNDSGYISNELAPTSAGSNSYRADYAGFSYLYGYYAYGEMTMNLPITTSPDSDEDGLPDFLEKNKAVSSTVVASTHEHDTDGFVYSYNWTITFNRSAGSSLGTYTGTSPGSPTYSGDYQAVTWDGALSYNPSTKVCAVSLTEPSESSTLTGSSTFTINSSNLVTVSSFTALRNDGETISVNAFTLNRIGSTNRYSSTATVVDAGPETFWADHTNLHIEITAGDDSDSDGIPDLSDTTPFGPPPTYTGLATMDLVVNDAISIQLTATPTGVTYSAENLPVGLNLSRSGLLTGSASTSGSYNATITVSNLAGNAEATFLIEVISEFQAWLLDEGGAVDDLPGFDNEGDGIQNLLEYVYGLSLEEHDPHPRITLSVEVFAASGELRIQVPRIRKAEGVRYEVDFCYDLRSSWNRVASPSITKDTETELELAITCDTLNQKSVMVRVLAFLE
jgi:hypothetical protein